MLLLPGSVRILLATEPVDMRNGIDGLAAIVQGAWREDVYAGHYFVFVSRRRDSVKILTWDNGGFVVFYKRLEAGRFRRPVLPDDASSVPLDLDAARHAARRHRPLARPPHQKVDAGGSTTAARFDLCWPMAGGEHDCEWKERHEALTAKHVELATQHQALAESLNVLQHEFEKMKRQLLGPKSEKMPRVSDELRKEKADPAETKRKRRERSDSRKAHLEQKTTVHAVPPSQRQCPQCGGKDLRPLGKGKESIVYEYVPAHFVEKSQYAPSFVASVITSKCADSIPLYRLEKELHRIGPWRAAP